MYRFLSSGSAFEKILESPIDEAWFVSDFEKLTNILGKRFLTNWVERRVGKHIKSKVIMVHSQRNEETIFRPDKNYLRTTRYASENFDSPTHIMIYGDSVALITTTGENFGTVITSREYAKTMRSWFSEIWKISKEK